MKQKREKSTTTVGHYVRNADLLPAVIEAKQLGKVTNRLIVMIQMIAERYSKKANFAGYSFREDMVASAVENLCKNALKFNHEKYNNPFAFYTTAIHHSFLQFMADEKKHRNIRDKMLMDAGANPSYNFLDKEKDESFFDVKESDSIDISSEIVIEEDDSREESFDEALATAVDSEDEAAAKPKVQREQKFIYRDRLPGPVTKYGPGNFSIDPITGAYVLKKEEPPVEEKQPVAKKATVKKVAEKKKTVASEKKQPKAVAVSTAKKTAVKKETVKKVAVKKVAVKKVAVKKPAEKKTAVKKETVKKVTAKKPKAVKAPAKKQSTTKDSKKKNV